MNYSSKTIGSITLIVEEIYFEIAFNLGELKLDFYGIG